MKRPRKTVTATRDLLRLLWQQPLLAIPFALFFCFLYGRFPQSLPPLYLISLVFTTVIGLAIWAVRWFALRDRADSRGWKKPVLYYSVSSMVAAVVAALIVNATLMPGFLTGGGRNLVIILLFAALFCALFMGIGMAMSFYRDVIENAKAEQELNLARRIQRSFLLSSFPRRPQIEIHAVNLSSREVSGDFYDVVPVGDEGVLLAIADVSGKGVPAALLSSMLQASMRTQAGTGPSVSAMMTRINALVCQRPTTGQFATFFLAWVDERSMRMRFTNAGHNFPLLLRDGTRRTLETGGTVVGMTEDLPWHEEEIPLAPGDRVVMYTDGVTEAMNADGEMYGEERLYAVLDAMPEALAADAMVDHIHGALRDFLGEMEPGDDVTLMVLRVLGQSPARGA